MTGIKDDLHEKLSEVQAALLAAVEDVSEYDLRRPMTPTGTNLLGLVKHVASVGYVYLGDSVGRPAPETMRWNEDGSVWDGGDMWATPDETRDYVLGLYRRSCAHGDASIDALQIDSPASVPHWPEATRGTTLGYLLVRMIAETAQHAGHAEIVRELVDGRSGSDTHDSGIDWPTYLARVDAAADPFR